MIAVSSLFSQILSHVSRNDFATLVAKHGAERKAKGFTCWEQFVAMLFSQLAQADSLREICNGLRCCLGKIKHLGTDKAPNKSTLAYANQHRPAAFFEALFYDTYQRLAKDGGFGCRKAKFRFKNKLLSLDSTTVSLCLSLFPWAKFRTAKGGVKVHVMLDHDSYMPTFVNITEAKQHDVHMARLLQLNPGSIIALDRAYIDYALFARWTDEGVFFVTRMKENAVYAVLEERTPPKNSNITSDQTILLDGNASEEKCPHTLRRVVVRDEEHQRDIVLLTNHLDFGATTISNIYKDRWEIELFFKALKQNLKVKSFVGTSENALKIQIWTALIAMLFLKWLHHLSKASWSFSNLVAMLRLNLFTYRDLTAWIQNPFDTPSLIPSPQLALPLKGLGQPMVD